jgi:ribA/ribD-fused uncharacterized protein
MFADVLHRRPVWESQLGPQERHQELIAAERAGVPLDLLRFHGSRPNKLDGALGLGCLHQEWAQPFTVDDVVYHTAEHYYLSHKAQLFGDRAARDAILATPHVPVAKHIASRIRGFDDEIWRAAQYTVVVAGNLAKFTALPELGAFLLATGEQVIVYANPADRVLSIGLSRRDPAVLTPSAWRGQNLLGFALTDVRSMLAANSPTSEVQAHV